MGWLPHLAHEVSNKNVADHLSALAAYGLGVCVAVPTANGLLLGTWLRAAKSDGALRWWHYALGGRDARWTSPASVDTIRLGRTEPYWSWLY